MAMGLLLVPLFNSLLILIWCSQTLVVFAVEDIAGGGNGNGTSREAELEVIREADRVINLPGQPPVSFPHYAGYVQLPNYHNSHNSSSSSNKALFYWFFHAQQNASSKPLVLWLNGGPGCSSVAYGAAQELGPFLVRSNGTLILNNFSWNKVANVLFLEAPVGVGFSYTNNSKDVETLGDAVTAADSYAFLVEWFKRFPAFKSHEFYIAGESYAGHYVPQLADLIYQRNKHSSSSSSYINLKGFMIGNAVINGPTDSRGMFDYAWSHAIISDQLYYNLVKECDFENENNQTEHCNDHMRAFLQAFSDIDIYGIYAPVCLSSSSSSSSNPNKVKASTYNSIKLLVAPRLLTQHELWHRLPSGYDPCTEDYVEQYFNREDVQRALHANVTKLSYPYTPCSGVIKGWNDSPDTLLPVIQKLLKAGLRIWIYSGDTDGRVPVTSTRYSIKEMGLRVKQEWRAWFDGGQVAGWAETYEEGGGLTFATVRGAGHQVPAFAPRQSLSLFTHFLSPNATLPSSRFHPKP
ncbi:serine carboxypeptidase-like 35 [Prunus avium]|uniref:Carboxypeptidase n=1 Tax=Prunus avium TaxID=42229 RepID=A0A6P5SCW7_PRUAV|nr:serine carboxypeptidase-like 35 [Prunus avium]